MKPRILKASVLISLLLCAACSNSASSADSVSDFRKARWGMSPAEVKATEQIKLLTSDNPPKPQSFGIINHETIAGLDVKVTYSFAYNKLIQGFYEVNTQHTNPTSYISDYDRLVKALTERYGAPLYNKEVWKDNLFKGDPSKWGQAIAVSHMSKIAHWATDKSGIDLLLMGDNFKIQLSIIYSSLNKEHIALGKQAEMANDKDKL